MGTHKSFEVLLDTEIPDSLKYLLPKTIYGIEGKLQYRHEDPMDKLGHIDHKWVLNVFRGDKIIAVAVFIQRGTDDERLFYVRYVSFDTSFKTKGGVQRLVKNEKKDGIQEAIIQQIHQKLFHTSEKYPSKALCFSYIEEENTASLKLSQRFGYEPVREMQTFVFNRFFPKDHKQVTVLAPEHRPSVLAHVHRQYQSYNFFDEATLWKGGTHYVLRHGDQIVAGLKATACSWEIINLPGFEGFMIQHVFSKLPILSKIFHKDKIKFIAMEGLWYKPGFENQLPVLMEAVCAKEGLHMAMLWFDTASKVGDDLLEFGKLGLLQKVNKSGKAKVMCKFEGYEEDEKQKFKIFPAYISATDVT